jgi:hypothetical protein
MRVLQFAPPFSYSFQCASTLLITYIPVYMYATSLQLLAIAFALITIFASNRTGSEYPEWFKRLFVRVCWLTPSTRDTELSSIPLIEPHQILSTVTNNLIIFLTFGLCSPVLGCYLALCISVRLLFWRTMIGRFVFSRLETERSLTTDPLLAVVSTNPLNEATATSLELTEKGDKVSKSGDDQLLSHLESQLRDVTSALVVCKWPVVLICAFFFTSICWDIAGDETGWSRALWVPIVGAVMVIVLWFWDRRLTSGAGIAVDRCLPLLFSSPSLSQSHPARPPSNSIELPANIVSRSSLKVDVDQSV